MDQFCDAYYKAKKRGDEIGLQVYFGWEAGFQGTDFLIYGLEKEWYRKHPEILEMEKREELAFLMEAGAFVVQAHPYREAHYIDHIRLFPRSVHGVEVVNSSQTPAANKMAAVYAKQYSLLETYGSDNHWGSRVFAKLREKGYRPVIAGMSSKMELCSAEDFIRQVKNRQMKPFFQGES